MNTFLKTNKTLFTYSLIFLLVIPIFGINFFLGIIGNFIILLFLIPVIFLIILFLIFNSLKSKVNTCSQCGTVSIGLSNQCMNCGFNFEELNIKEKNTATSPSERTIEIKAEEIN